MRDFAFNRALDSVWRLLAMINGYVVAREPWKIRKEEGASDRLHRVLSAAAEGMRLVGVLLSPFVPATARRIFQTLGLPPRDPQAADLEWGGLPANVPLSEEAPLFPRVDGAIYLGAAKEATLDEKTTSPNPSAPPPVETTQAATPSDTRIGIEEFQKVSLVTAKVLEADRVPKSNKLIRMRVDIGTGERQIVAGIGKRYTPEELIGRNVVVVANLKPARLMGVESDGMALAATVGEAGDPVLLDLPAEVPPGSRVK
jgi:methionyl-tRNA synthetase